MDKRRCLRKLNYVLLLIVISYTSYGQNRNAKDLFPLFWGTNIENLQTSQTLPQGELELRIFHRFGEISTGADDMFGVYAPSNITMGLAYGITSNLLVVFDAEKQNRFYDLSLKYRFLTQKTDNSIPLSVSYIFTSSYSGMGKENYGVTYQAANRWSYLNQLVAEKQIGYKLNTMLGVYYSHHNAAKPTQPHDIGALSFAMGYRFGKKMSIFANYQYNQALTCFGDDSSRDEVGKDGASIGISYGTPTHKFQVFVGNQYGINTGDNMANNAYELSSSNLRIGFNISVRLLHNKKS